MKKIYINSIISLLALTLGACSSDNPFLNQEEAEMGSLSTRTMLVQVETAEQVRASFDVERFVVEIVNDQQETVANYVYAEMPDIIPLKAGDYTVNVHSGVNPNAEWDSPWFKGSKQFSVEARKISELDEAIVCKFANVRVSVYFDGNLKNAMADDAVVTVEVGDGGSLDFGKNESRSGYFAYVEGSNTLVATFQGVVDDYIREDFKTYQDVTPGNHYKITYRYAGADAPNIDGDIDLGDGGIVVDSEVEEIGATTDVNPDDEAILDENERPQEDPIVPDVPDTPDGPDNEDPDVPVVTGDGPELTPVAPLSFDSPVEVTTGMKAEINVHSETGITGFAVDIVSDVLTPSELATAGLAAPVTTVNGKEASHLDFVNPGDLKEALEGLGFPTNVKGQKDLTFTITDFMSLLAVLGSAEHQFILTVTDAEGTTTKTLTLVVK